MPEENELGKYELLDVLGTPGLKQYGGRLDEEWLKQLKGDKGVKAFQEMRDNDPIIGAILYAVKTLVRQTGWRIEPAEDTPEHQAVADFVEECREDMEHTWDDLLAEILSMLPFGWAYFECVYKYRRGPEAEGDAERSKFNDGKIGWRKIAIRAQETLSKWEFDEAGTTIGMWQQAPPDYRMRFIPIEKSLLFRTETHKENPEGRSILRNAYRSWFYLKRIQEIEAVGIERDLAGLPVAHVPLEMLSPSASAAQKATVANIFEMVRKVKRNEFEGVVFPAETDIDGNPSGFKFSLLSSGGRRPLDVNEIVKRYESRIAMSVLGEFVMLGMDNVGSFALSSNKTHLFAQALGSYLEQISEVFNRVAIPKLLKYNGISPELYPKLVFEDIETPDLGELAGAIGALSSAGVLTPDDELERWVRDFGNMPMPDTTSEREEPDLPGGDLEEEAGLEKSYANTLELPDVVRSRIPSVEGRTIWLRSFNETEKETKDESRAVSEAWAALERAGYQKNKEGNYVKVVRNDEAAAEGEYNVG
ncbi:hypothetical protein CMI37_18100 [Candidatus Pacearchaeota archaeon]|nr:hypothetical protein [Candidatus Pacearchaeota archaeon]|tara:strand:- start:396 stop:1994 length:1599 start_codon:yes stop_codon:yes gene_type:complete